ncbi:MAG: hypothetical protein RI544_07515, partial [Haloquadratum sp.]|nr:hypothetical protein [Haloquadratum sp.]
LRERWQYWYPVDYRFSANDLISNHLRKMLPGRRDAMKLGGAAVIGAAAMSGTASANAGTDNDQVGTIGADPDDYVDIYSHSHRSVPREHGPARGRCVHPPGSSPSGRVGHR